MIKHYKFCVTLNLRTPLAVLEHHGETHPGPPNALPEYSGQQDGIWVMVLQSWADLAGPDADPAAIRKMRELESGKTIASDVGPVPEDGGDYLAFLKSFRKIVEAPTAAESKRVEMQDLTSRPEFRKYAKKHKRRLAEWPL